MGVTSINSECQEMNTKAGEMAEERAEKNLSCSICLDLLKEPVTIPCGHNYCSLCINRFWDGEKMKMKIYRCPQCRETFTLRPVVRKNTTLSGLVEDLKSRLKAAPSPAAEDVDCDVCTGTKRKASKSCLNCVASFCEDHLQPHCEAPALKRHKLVAPSGKMEDVICSRHHEVKKMFCRTDQHFICIICSMEEHKYHNTVSAAAEKTEKQKELQNSRADIHKNIQDGEKDVEILEQLVKTIDLAADQTVKKNDQIFTELIRLLHQNMAELEKEVQSKQQTEVSAVRALQEKLKQDISEMRKRDAELQQISSTEDDIQFVLSYSSLSACSVSKHSSIIHKDPRSCFEEVTAAVSQLKEHLNKVLIKDLKKVSQTVMKVDYLPSEPVNRAGFLKYQQKITLDPNTAHKKLQLSSENRKATLTDRDQRRLDHPDRFTERFQVLSRESLTGRCYWEVEWGGEEVEVMVVYKSISRAGSEDEKSWSLAWTPDDYIYSHNNILTLVSGPQSPRIGVYVDHTEGILSFYIPSTSMEEMTLLHRVNTTFAEPLHAGVYIKKDGGSAEICKL